MKRINVFNKYLHPFGYMKLQHFCQQHVKVKRTPKKITHSAELNNYLSTDPNLIKIKETIPPRFLKRNSKSPDDLYLIDKDVACIIATALQPYVSGCNSTIIETNPGYGFLSENLLKFNVNKLQLYESTTYFQEHLIKTYNKYLNRFKIYNRDFFSIWKLSYQDRQDNGNRVKLMLSDIEIRSWKDEPTIKIIGAAATPFFLRFLIQSLIFQYSITSYGRCELYLILPPFLYMQLTAQPETGYLLYRSSSVLFQLLCDYEILAKVPRKVFLPWDNTVKTKLKSKLKNFYSTDSEMMYLTRIVFKKDLPVSEDRLKHLWYFVRCTMLSRKNRIIPTIEKWVPGSGLRLILTNREVNLKTNPHIYPNLNVYTQIGSLKPLQILHLYNEFSSWSEYLECSFIHSMEVSLSKNESMQDLDGQSSVENKREEHEDTDSEQRDT